jgi:hypothetical protein
MSPQPIAAAKRRASGTFCREVTAIGAHRRGTILIDVTARLL